MTNVAAIIPARPAEPFLREAVESVLRQPEIAELVIATHQNGTPTANLAACHPDSRVRLVISNGPSAGENLDAGIAATESEWLAFLDADDLWPEGRVAAGLRAAGEVTGCQLILGLQQAMTADGTLLEQTEWAMLGAALITRGAAARLGPLGNSLIAPMRWVLRGRDLGIPTVELPEVLLYRRGHEANLTRRQRPALHQEYLKLARERSAMYQQHRKDQS